MGAVALRAEEEADAAASMAQEVMESTLRGAVVVRLCRCLEDCAAAPNAPGESLGEALRSFASVHHSLSPSRFLFEGSLGHVLAGSEPCSLLGGQVLKL